MCGIAGLFHCGTPKPVDPARIKRMCDALEHRGPDGEGVWTDAGVGLGHRRLSIIDLEGSPQPMHAADGTAVLVFNGEIYNFRELRRELEGQGANFRTDGDSEVILAAWQRWGIDCLERLHGMFAFALYDRKRKELLLARDRLGVKPLFMAPLSDGSLAFASELKGLLAHPLLRRETDPLAVEDYMTWGYVPDHRSILKGVEKLPAGHFRLLKHGQPAPPPRQWWDVSFAERKKGKDADLSVELLHHMREGVTSRMEADVPLGAFLSGGVDSSSVVALMAESNRDPVTTCSIGFDVAALDETGYAEKVAGLFGTNHHSRTVQPDDFHEIDRLVGMFDEPFADASALPTWRVCQLAREHVTVALSGDGADEAFAGYRRQVFHAREEQARALLPEFLRKPIFGGLGAIWPKADWAPRPLRAKSTLQSLAQDGATGYARSLSVIPPEIRQKLFSDEFKRELGEYRAEQPFIDLMRNAPARSGLDRAQYADLKFWLQGDILTKVDRASMSVSLEAREPLLDHRLIEFAAQLPHRARVRGMQGKWLVKHTMERYLPDDILYRPKQGFVTPISDWFRGPLAAEAKAISSSAGLARTGWFNPRALAKIADDHIAKRADHGRILWQLLMLERSIKHLQVVR
ncbi:amidotransferase 1, exosortase A system-associated [Pontixanthobacter aestiaquae]|uniref:asparagine synthase (glutamine-hydrolyzing) n=1 Tax=Pontixanthobacter aestiaquae TaxID=1509367 RepID=A0A844Z9N2_9SPHN|nr:XrtA/PEP-CTERM system amidotransferase [Pontixanthobacter aestiaquae]MDN3645285.1 amidotransferase 1, exosortase A system-associated [Pontixanthobacter aestiaquae]MXO83713.1 amidotransferase 1, exosortase A system-associated [Pontixanthobacter aestiaquae]